MPDCQMETAFLSSVPDASTSRASAADSSALPGKTRRTVSDGVECQRAMSHFAPERI